jgi:hypothetical protein
MWSIMTALLKAKRATEFARDCDKVETLLPTIKSDSAGFAWWSSRLLIHPSLQGLHTTFAVRSIAWLRHSLTIFPSSSLCLNLKPLLLNSLRIQSLHRCSPDSLAVAGQNAHSRCINALYKWQSSNQSRRKSASRARYLVRSGVGPDKIGLFRRRKHPLLWRGRFHFFLSCLLRHGWVASCRGSVSPTWFPRARAGLQATITFGNRCPRWIRWNNVGMCFLILVLRFKLR